MTAGVLGRPYLARQDIVVGVGSHQRLGFRWLQQEVGAEPVPMNLAGHTGLVRFASGSGIPWVEFPATTRSDGLILVEITPALTDGPEWMARGAGQWSLTVTSPQGIVTRVAAGNLQIITTGSF